MKPLLSTKVTRDCVDLKEWKASEHHLTDDGREEFRARQLARIKAADKARADVTAKIQPIKRKA